MANDSPHRCMCFVVVVVACMFFGVCVFFCVGVYVVGVVLVSNKY